MADLTWLTLLDASAVAKLPPPTNTSVYGDSTITSGYTERGDWSIWIFHPSPTSPAQYHTNFTIDGTPYYIQPPLLNIEAVATPEGWDHPLFRDADAAWRGSESTLQYYNMPGALLRFDQIDDLVVCLPSDYYEWGVSLLMLFIFFFFTPVFLAILATLRYKLHYSTAVLTFCGQQKARIATS